MNAGQALQLYNRFRQEHNGVFLITRNCDAKMYLYTAEREANQLVRQKVRCTSILAPDWHKQESVPEVLMNHFFGLNVQSMTNSSKYTANMVAFPERFMTLHLKKNSSEGKSDGSVTATLTFHVAPNVVVEDVQFLLMEQDMKFDDMEIPDITCVRLFGCVNKANIKHLTPTIIAQCCTELSATQVLIVEILPVTDEMRKRFDVKALARQWFISKAKATLA